MQALPSDGCGPRRASRRQGETGEVGLGEVQLAQCGEVEGEIGCYALGGRRGRRGWGRRMSVTEIWARMLPSMNSTREWTVDWGWMVTRTCAGGRSKRRQASMTSKPLFIMVAESMVMRWPMTQVGCLRACWGVMWAKVRQRCVAEGAA